MSVWYEITIKCWKLNESKIKKVKSSLRKFGFKIGEDNKKDGFDNVFDISMIIPLKEKVTEKNGEVYEKLDCDCTVGFHQDSIWFGRGCYFSSNLGLLKFELLLVEIEKWILKMFTVGTIIRYGVECDLTATGIVTKDKIEWVKTYVSAQNGDKTKLS
jgi:hypothetical protein